MTVAGGACTESSRAPSPSPNAPLPNTSTSSPYTMAKPQAAYGGIFRRNMNTFNPENASMRFEPFADTTLALENPENVGVGGGAWLPQNLPPEVFVTPAPLAPQREFPLPKRLRLAARDKESLLEEIISLKAELNLQGRKFLAQRIHSSTVEVENKKLEKDVGDLEQQSGDAAPRTGGHEKLRSKLHGMKSKMEGLYNLCEDQRDELVGLRRDIRLTRARELEIERDVFSEEVVRLLKLLKRVKGWANRLNCENKELSVVKDRAVLLDIANKRLETCLMAIQKNLERTQQEAGSYRQKMLEAVNGGKQDERRCMEMEELAGRLQAMLDSEKNEKERWQKKASKMEGDIRRMEVDIRKLTESLKVCQEEFKVCQEKLKVASSSPTPRTESSRKSSSKATPRSPLRSAKSVSNSTPRGSKVPRLSLIQAKEAADDRRPSVVSREEALKKAAEAEKKAIDLEKKRKQAEANEAFRKKREEEEAKKKEEDMKKKEEEERKKAAEDEIKRKKAEAKKKAIQERLKQKEEEERKKKEEERKIAEEEERVRKEEEEKKRVEEEEKVKKQKEELRQKREEEKKRREEERKEEERRVAEEMKRVEEEHQRIKQEEEMIAQAGEEEKERLLQEQARRLKEEEDRRKAEERRRLEKEVEEKLRIEDELRAKRKREEDERRRRNIGTGSDEVVETDVAGGNAGDGGAGGGGGGDVVDDDGDTEARMNKKNVKYRRGKSHFMKSDSYAEDTKQVMERSNFNELRASRASVGFINPSQLAAAGAGGSAGASTSSTPPKVRKSMSPGAHR